MNNRLARRIGVLRLKKLAGNQFIYIVSIIIGVFVGLAAVIIKKGVHYLQELLSLADSFEYQHYLHLHKNLIPHLFLEKWQPD